MQEHMTSTNPELESKARETFDGQAHFANTGPVGVTCRSCIHWQLYEGQPTYRQEDEQLHARTCQKFCAMMRRRSGPRVPHYAPACKYFEENTSPPPIWRPRQPQAPQDAPE